MARRVLTPRGDGRSIGMYSAGFEVDPGRLVFVAGQVAMDANGQVVGAGDFAAQAAQVYRNLGAVLGEAGCTFREVMKFTTFLTRYEDFAAFAEWRKGAYPTLFPDGVYPPNTGVVVQSLARPGLLLEVEAIAVKPGRPAAARTAPPARRPARKGAKRPVRRAGRRR
ncbi:MAG: RidA family protein [Candidatus Rokubacteria bacterium]|nr:RidA family protein [Candidatus Rokubacteria bacterium]